ncbi:alpha-keto acid decarboxylase family protein [Peribacillus kribbensis]|uniref:alpha-keto acid decarboxylase family protein n=1 Tax=Peribacillus kribbensis TaxID=356658 RepID=UPI000478DEEA|nr:thiamine pyrophosphate-binding protein [Peribacillus kribbensis]
MNQKMELENKTVGEFLFDCLKNEGVTEIFGVPGDFNFSLLDTLEKYEDIQFINGRNELNAGYAADAYARLRGLSAMITTFGVGEMSACNSVAGAYSENVPLIHIAGSPKSQEQQEKKLLHHTLMDGDFDVFHRMYEQITIYSAKVTPENAALEIPKAINMAKVHQKPVYLVMAIDQVTEKVVPHLEAEEDAKTTSSASLHQAGEHAQALLSQAKNAVILTDNMAYRKRLGGKVKELAEGMNAPVAALMQGKGGFDETHPFFIGVYSGEFGDENVRRIVEEADVIISVGLIRSDMNMAKYTASLDSARMIDIHPEFTKIGAAQYMNLMAEDMLEALAGIKFTQEAPEPARFPYEEVTEFQEEPIQAKYYYPRIQKMLKSQDILVVETGTFTYGMSQIRLPKGADYIAQGGWQSIGYATPAAFGASVAAKDRRVILFTGDGSLQLTVQEISSMLANGCKPIIFVLNNQGYTIEKYLNVQVEIEKQDYNDIPLWNYTKLTEVFGGEAYTAAVKTMGELDSAIEAAEQQDQLAIIELQTSESMDAPEYLKKMREMLEKQKQQSE